jgi:ParB family transcriptional regulator, chromosome partitioning protein
MRKMMAIKGEEIKEAAKAAAKAGRFNRATMLLEKVPTAYHEDTPDTMLLSEKNASSGIEKNRSGRFERVDVDAVDMNPYNARKIYKPNRIGSLAESIIANGQIQPAIATIRNGRYLLIAGHYRLAAIRKANLKKIDLMVYDDLSDRDLFEYSYRENSEREQQSALDDALAWKNLLDTKIFDNETDLAVSVRKSLSTVNRTLSILKLSPQIIDFISQDPELYAMSCLSELVLLESAAGSTIALNFAEKLGKGEIGRKEIIETRKKFLTSLKKTRNTSRKYTITSSDGSEIGFIKEWDSGRVSIEIKISDSKDRIAVINEFKSRFL